MSVMPMPAHNINNEAAALPKISIIGLGKLGAPMAAVFAVAGMAVQGYDINDQYVADMAKGRAPVDETGLQDLINEAGNNISATSDLHAAIANSDISFIIVPTPCDETGEFTNDYVLNAVEKIGEAIATKATRHTVVITSTVMPGSTGGVIADTLSQAAGKLVGSGELGLCYSPEFIALGSVIKDMQNPDFILIGESDPASGDMLERIYNAACTHPPAYYRMNFVNAELTKISVNSFVTTKISYANMLADLCSHLPGADVDIVTDAVGADSRIGKKYLKGAVSYGGPCFPRDNRAFSALGDRIGANCGLAKATDSLNSYQIDRLVNAIKLAAPTASRIAVLGLSYKPDTHVIEQSAGLDLVRRLKSQGYDVTSHDPMATAEARRLPDIADTVIDTLPEALSAADVAVVATPWPDYKKLKTPTSVTTIIDPWRILKTSDIATGIDLISLGRT